MGSPSGLKKFGHYTGNGSATAREFVLTFEPKTVKVLSVRGQAVWTERTPGVFKILDSAVPSVLTGHLAVLTDKGFVLTSTDATLNENGVEYYYEAE